MPAIYDITRVFIDGLYKITGVKDVAKAEAFLDALDAFSAQHSVNFTVLVERGAVVRDRKHEALFIRDT